MEINGMKIQFLGHSGFLIEGNSKKIAIDPYKVGVSIEKADLILITHSHYDHCSIEDISKLVKYGTLVIIPADAQSKLTKIEGADSQIVEIGDELNFGGIKIEVVPAYNLSKEFHPKSEGWFGYIIKFGKVIIYHAGDSDSIPEMKKLTGYGREGNEFIVLLPVSGKYVMDVEEAVEAASFLSPDLVIPMHYGSGVAGTREDAERFVKRCNEININAKILEKM